jgi:hypothetical protein
LPFSRVGGADPAFCSGSGTPDPLMRPGMVEGEDIRVEYALELFLIQDEQIVEAFTPHTPEKTFTDGIGSWGVIRYGENLDVTRLGNSCEAHPELAIMITDEILRPLSKGGGLPQRYVRSKCR